MSDSRPSPPGATGDDGARQIDRALFEAASDIDDADARREFLATACGENAERLSRIQSWLEVQDSAESFFRHAAVARTEVGSDVTQAWDSGELKARGLQPEPNEPGSRIGHYRLLEKIGEGGCGVVYLAEQLEPVRRRVALKVIRSGLDSAGVVARFESERQTLAMMDHPGIAKVFDAGATESGRPYFVMELVSGEKITDHCDTNQLGPRKRLELFIQVCQAIQHAHQKGVIHRDIKPSNVMVTLQDGAAVPKVIDFGIARAIEGRMTDHTAATALGQLVGTPAYMSPEQAEGGESPDTRSDVYSLGALLYELLTGRSPFDGKRLTNVGLFEMLRILREEEPSWPSMVLSRLTPDELSTVAVARNRTASTLVAGVRGDLDCIVAKAMAKDRRARYDTVNGLAMDLARFLNDEPVTARPPGSIYLFRKLLRRHKLGFAAAVAVAVALVAGFAVSSWFYVRERRAKEIQTHLRAIAEAAHANEARLLFQSKARESISQAAMLLAEGKIVEADALLKETPLSSIEPSMEAANVLRTLGDWNAIRQRWRQAAECYLLYLQANRLSPLLEPKQDWLVQLSIAPTLLEAENPVEYERLRSDIITRHGMITDPLERTILLKACLLLPADKDLLGRLQPHADALKTLLAEKATSNFHGGFAALSLAMMSWRSGDFASTLGWSNRCLSYPQRHQSRDATAYVLAAMAEHGLGHSEQARFDLEKARAILAGPFDPDSYNPRGEANGNWLNWSIARILEREASALKGISGRGER